MAVRSSDGKRARKIFLQIHTQQQVTRVDFDRESEYHDEKTLLVIYVCLCGAWRSRCEPSTDEKNRIVTSACIFVKTAMHKGEFVCRIRIS